MTYTNLIPTLTHNMQIPIYLYIEREGETSPSVSPPSYRYHHPPIPINLKITLELWLKQHHKNLTLTCKYIVSSNFNSWLLSQFLYCIESQSNLIDAASIVISWQSQKLKEHCYLSRVITSRSNHEVFRLFDSHLRNTWVDEMKMRDFRYSSSKLIQVFVMPSLDNLLC